MRKFIKRPDITFGVIPGVGRIVEGTVLEGEQFARFVPSVLVELLEEPKPSVVVPPPAPMRTVEAPPTPVAPLLTETPPEPPKALTEAPEPKKEASKPAPAKPAPTPAPATKKTSSKK